jgi:hypothetical protein
MNACRNRNQVFPLEECDLMPRDKLPQAAMPPAWKEMLG